MWLWLLRAGARGLVDPLFLSGGAGSVALSWRGGHDAHAPARMSVRIRTRLYAALVNVKIQPTFSRPR